MTALIWELSEQHVALLCDTLLTDGDDKRPMAMVTKAFYSANLGAIICGTGLASVTSNFYLRASQGIVATDVVHLNEFAQAQIAGVFEGLNAPEGMTATVYTFGWSVAEQRFVGFAYRSTSGFISERICYGFASKPPPGDLSVLDEIKEWDDLRKVMHVQKDEDRARPRPDRVGIGGDIIQYIMMRDDSGKLIVSIQHVERFGDFQSDWTTILAKLPRESRPSAFEAATVVRGLSIDASMNSVELVRAAPQQREVIARLMQYYLYDFTELMAPEKIPELRETGDFGDYPYLDEYWTDATRTPYVVRVGGKLAGFALLNKHSHIGRPVDFNMGEFFIARPFRRRGAAISAVHQLLKMHPGSWEIAIGAYNKPAQIFWPRAIAAAQVSDLENLEGDGVEWTGPILRFRTG